MGLIRGGSFESATAGPPRTSSLGTLEVLSGWHAIGSVRGAWEALFNDYSHPAPGMTWGVIEALRQVTPQDTLPLVACMPDSRRPDVLLALQTRRIGPIRVVEPLGRGLLDRHEPLVSRGGLVSDPGRQFRLLARRLGRDVLFDLPRLRPTARGSRWLVDRLGRAHGWGVSGEPGECQLSLSGGWPRVEASLGLSLRRAAGDGRSRIRRNGVPFEVRVARPEPLELLDELIDLGRPGTDPDDRARRHVLRRLVADAAGARRLRCAVVLVDGRLAAGTVAWVCARQAVELLAASRPAASRWHPQAIADLALLEHLARYERLDRLLLDRDRAPAAVLAPEPRPRLVGAPQPGLARVVSTAMHRALEGKDALLVGVAGLVARILRARRRRRRPTSRPVPPSLGADIVEGTAARDPGRKEDAVARARSSGRPTVEVDASR